jgi:hypothetical protein
MKRRNVGDGINDLIQSTAQSVNEEQSSRGSKGGLP